MVELVVQPCFEIFRNALKGSAGHSRSKAFSIVVLATIDLRVADWPSAFAIFVGAGIYFLCKYARLPFKGVVALFAQTSRKDVAAYDTCFACVSTTMGRANLGHYCLCVCVLDGKECVAVAVYLF